MTELTEADGVPQTNGFDEEDERTKMRPADIDADMKEMERRKRVEMIMSSRLFREELERIIELQMKDGNGPAGLLQQISDMMGIQSGKLQSTNFFKSSNCVVPINDIRGVESMGYAKGEKILRCKLAALYRLMDLYGWTQNIHNHITARLNQEQENFLINPFGMLYHEITASSLVKVDMQGQVVESGTTNFSVNVSGFQLHAAVHSARPDIKCIIHLHTPSVLAVSSLKCGLLPLSQESVVIGEVSYHPYLGSLNEPEEKEKLARDLGPMNKVMFLTNHGVVCCGESIEEAFYNVYNTVLACETQLKLMPVGIENLQLIPDETRKQIYDTARNAPEITIPTSSQIDKKEKRVRIGSLEFEALMRMLDNAGFRTGYIYRQPLIKGDPPRPRNDVEVPPAVSSLGYLLEEEEMYKHGNWKKYVDGRKTNDRTRWLNSPNVYQKVEILETGTPDPKKITKWVEANAEEWVADGSPQHSSTPVKIESALQFVPKNTNPKEFKKLQQLIKENRRADKITSGPQSHILEGVSWEEAKKLQDANISQTGDQVILVGAASKGIIQRGFQHNATVYKTPYAKNPFDAVSDQEIEDYKRVVIRKQKGESSYDEDQSESEALSYPALPSAGIKSPASETEEESREEPRVLRIETKQVPRPSQAEVVLSEDACGSTIGSSTQEVDWSSQVASYPNLSQSHPQCIMVSSKYLNPLMPKKIILPRTGHSTADTHLFEVVTDSLSNWTDERVKVKNIVNTFGSSNLSSNSINSTKEIKNKISIAKQNFFQVQSFSNELDFNDTSSFVSENSISTFKEVNINKSIIDSPLSYELVHFNELDSEDETSNEVIQSTKEITSVKGVNANPINIFKSKRFPNFISHESEQGHFFQVSSNEISMNINVLKRVLSISLFSSSFIKYDRMHYTCADTMTLLKLSNQDSCSINQNSFESNSNNPPGAKPLLCLASDKSPGAKPLLCLVSDKSSGAKPLLCLASDKSPGAKPLLCLASDKSPGAKPLLCLASDKSPRAKPLLCLDKSDQNVFSGLLNVCTSNQINGVDMNCSIITVSNCNYEKEINYMLQRMQPVLRFLNGNDNNILNALIVKDLSTSDVNMNVICDLVNFMKGKYTSESNMSCNRTLFDDINTREYNKYQLEFQHSDVTSSEHCITQYCTSNITMSHGCPNATEGTGNLSYMHRLLYNDDKVNLSKNKQKEKILDKYVFEYSTVEKNEILKSCRKILPSVVLFNNNECAIMGKEDSKDSCSKFVKSNEYILTDITETEMQQVAQCSTDFCLNDFIGSQFENGCDESINSVIDVDREPYYKVANSLLSSSSSPEPSSENLDYEIIFPINKPSYNSLVDSCDGQDNIIEVKSSYQSNIESYKKSSIDNKMPTFLVFDKSVPEKYENCSAINVSQQRSLKLSKQNSDVSDNCIALGEGTTALNSQNFDTSLQSLLLCNYGNNNKLNIDNAVLKNINPLDVYYLNNLALLASPVSINEKDVHNPIDMIENRSLTVPIPDFVDTSSFLAQSSLMADKLSYSKNMYSQSNVCDKYHNMSLGCFVNKSNNDKCIIKDCKCNKNMIVSNYFEACSSSISDTQKELNDNSDSELFTAQSYVSGNAVDEDISCVFKCSHNSTISKGNFLVHSETDSLNNVDINRTSYNHNNCFQNSYMDSKKPTFLLPIPESKEDE